MNLIHLQCVGFTLTDVKMCVHMCTTYHNWLTEILVHCCPPQGGEVYTVKGGLVPEDQTRKSHLDI